MKKKIIISLFFFAGLVLANTIVLTNSTPNIKDLSLKSLSLVPIAQAEEPREEKCGYCIWCTYNTVMLTCYYNENCMGFCNNTNCMYGIC